MKPIKNLTEDEFAELLQKALRLPDAPTEVVQAAIDLWPNTRADASGKLIETAIQTVQAVLSFDSWAQPALALGVRSTATDKRHLLFSAGERDVDLRIDREADAFSISGQILGPDESGTVELATDSESSRSDVQADDPQRPREGRMTTLNHLGEFHLSAIEAGTYRLTLRLGPDEVTLRPIFVGERAE